MANLDSTPIAMMTARQLKDYLFGDDAATRTNTKQHEQPTEKRYLYSVKQLANFLKASYPTAWKLKETVLRPAIYQQGRTILIDTDKVLQLMSEKDG